MSTFLGLYLRPGYLEVAEAETAENARVLGTVTIADGKWDGKSVISALKDQSLKLKKNYEGVSITIHSGQEIYRKMVFPFSKEQVSKTIHYEYFDQIKDIIVGTSNDYLFDYLILAERDNRTTTLGVASKSKEIRELIDGLDKLNLDPEKIIPELHAIVAFVKTCLPFASSGETLVLHTTPDDVFIVSLKQGEIADFRQLKIKLGEIHSTRAKLVKQTKSTSSKTDNKKLQAVESEYEEETFYKIASFTEKEIQEIKDLSATVTPEGVIESSEIKKNSLKRLLVQLQRTLFLMPNMPNELIITGMHANDQELINAIHSFGLKVYEPEKNVDLEHIASLGAVYTFFAKEHKSLSLRQGNLEYKGFFDKVAIPLSFCMLLLLAITVVMNVFLILKQQKLRAEITQLQQHGIKIVKTVDTQTTIEKKETNKTKNQDNNEKNVLQKIERRLFSLKKKADFEANVNEYEKRHPIISGLQAWLEYEKTKNNAMLQKIPIGNEQNIVVAQTNAGVHMNISKARTAGFAEAVNFLKLIKSLKYFNESKEREMKQDANNEVVFDFYVQKDYN